MTSTETAPPARTREQAETLCPQCGAELAEDQEWCLECGGARTLIHHGPDWRVPLAVIGTVIVLAIGGFVVALVSISNDSGHAAAAVTTTVTSQAASSTPTPATATTASGSTANIPGWPPGLGGWTVVLASTHKRAAAYADARRAAGHGIEVGVLDSSQHPRLAPGYWVVFSGRYPTRAAALSASSQLVSLGQTYAHPRLVGRPGSA